MTQERPHRFGPAEGWSVLLPHIAALALTAFTISKIGVHDRAAVLIPITVGGLLFGLMLAKLALLDSVAHLMAMATGAIASFSLVATRDAGAGVVIRQRGRPIYQLARDIVERFASGSGTKLPSVEVLVLVAITLWMVGYSSSWMLYRRQWMIPSLVLPGTMMMVTMRYDRTPPAFPVIGFLFCAILMSARHYAYRESRDWGRRRLTAPGGVPTKLATSGAAIAAIALVLGWSVTYHPSKTLRSDVSNQSAEVWSKVENLWSKTGLPGSQNSETAGAYPTFPNSFDIGGNLNLSDAVVADVAANAGHYLTARSYDRYNGKGWETTVDDTFAMAGDKANIHAIPIQFLPNQAVPFSTDIAAGRIASQANIHVYAKEDGLILTIESFDSSTLRTIATMGWVKLDDVEINIATVDVRSLPPDLQGLVNSLQQATFEPGREGGEPFIVQNNISGTVSAERERLRGFPIATTLKLGDDGAPILIVSGRLPNYDDIEAVRQPLASSGATQYQVSGVESSATEAQLRTAGTVYPEWVTQRYLQHSSTVTDRTKALAQSVAARAGATNPFDEAWALQQYLTGADFTYQLNSPGPSGGQDFVDYFLFDSKVGRCEQFATSMVVMLRELGVPSRLVSGYRIGEQDENGRWVYRENQAHTWVEVYFPGNGWLPFEPTKGQQPFAYGKTKAAAQLPAPTPAAIPTTAEPAATPAATATPIPTATPIAPVNNTDASSDDGRWWESLSGPLLAVLAIGLAIAIVLGGGAIAWIWGLRGMTPAASLYARVIRLGRFAGVRPDPAMTPSEFANEFSSVVPGAGPAVRVVTDLYLAERYGQTHVDASAEARGNGAWRQLRRNFFVWRSGRARRRRLDTGVTE